MNPPLRPYPETRDSGAAWLGRVPAHWAVRSVKRVFSIVGGATPKSGEPRYWDGDVVWVTPADVSRAPSLGDSARRITEEGRRSCSTELVPSRSLVVTSRAPVGNVAIAATSLCTNQGCKALVPGGDAEPLFHFHVLTVLKEELQSRAVGTTFAEISTDRLASVPIPVPPLAEQRSIARFLDHSCRRIGRYLAAKERLIKLLEEQKQAVIQRAVTRGLDPAVPHKLSGIEWLGDIPAHWEVVRVGRLFQQRNAPAATHLPILEVSIKTGVRVRQFDASHRKQVMSDRGGYQRAETGDLTYNMMRMWQGAVGIVPCDGLVSPAYVVAKPVSGADSRYFAPLFRTPEYRAGINGSSRGIVKDRNRLYWQDFKSIPALRPPAAEQQAIVAHLDRATAALDAAIARTRRQRELVAEYRTRLVADVATGKLDVREAARRLPAHPQDDGNEVSW